MKLSCQLLCLLLLQHLKLVGCLPLISKVDCKVQPFYHFLTSHAILTPPSALQLSIFLPSMLSKGFPALTGGAENSMVAASVEAMDT